MINVLERKGILTSKEVLDELEVILYFLGYNGKDLQELRSLVNRKEPLRFQVH